MTPRMIEPTEREFQAQIVELAELHGFAWYHTHDSRRSPAGFPDLILVKPPRFIAAELKTSSGRTRPEQKAWLELLARCPGIEVYLWRPDDFDGIARLLSGRAA